MEVIEASTKKGELDKQHSPEGSVGKGREEEFIKRKVCRRDRQLKRTFWGGGLPLDAHTVL